MKVILRKREAGKGEKYGAAKYGKVQSESDPKTFYDVVKVREHYGRVYVYRCTCADYLFRNNKSCKHIKAFKSAESKSITEGA